MFKPAKDVQIGDVVYRATGSGSIPTAVTRINRNPYHGWVGFGFRPEREDHHFDFYGWLKPEEQVRVAE